MSEWTPKVGDVVFRTSGDMIGDQVRRYSGSGSRFSHVGVVVANGASLAVVDISPFGAGKAAFTDIAAYIGEPTTIDVAVMRPEHPFDDGALSARARAIVARQLTFDFDFDASDPARMYCTEMAIDVLRHGDVRLADLSAHRMSLPMIGERDILTPEALATAGGLALIARKQVADN